MRDRTELGTEQNEGENRMRDRTEWTESQWHANAAFHSPYSEATGLPLDIWEQEPQSTVTDMLTSNITIQYIMMKCNVMHSLCTR